MKIIFIFICGLCMAFVSVAQKGVVVPKNIPKSTLSVWRQVKNDTVRLRWMPIEATDWVANNSAGYVVERAEVVKGKALVFKRLTAQPLRPTFSTPNSVEDKAAAKIINVEPVTTSIDNKLGQQEASQLTMRHLTASLIAFKSFKTAQKMGLGYTDSNFEKSKTYVYRIYSATAGFQVEKKADTAYVAINAARNTTRRLPPHLQKEELEKTVLLTWPAASYLKDFVLYHVEKSEDGKTYKRISSSPVMYSNKALKIAYFKDSLTQNYRPCLYRLIGITPFGELVTAPTFIMAMGRDRTPPSQPQIQSTRHLGGTRVEIKWTMPAHEGDLKGFWVSRAQNVSSQYEKVGRFVSKDSTRVVDYKADPTAANHYRVVAVDTAGNERASFPAYVAMNDTVVPAAPKGLMAKVITDKANKAGVVTLTWRRNIEMDVQGYYVYFANDPDHEFSQITKRMVADTVFKDTITLQSLTKNVYYKVVAVDKHFNISEFSAGAPAKRPDIIRPVAPLITEVAVKEDNTVSIRWQRSPSNDVVEYQLYRRESGKEWVKVKTFKSPEVFVDKLQSESVFEYFIQVVDDNGLVSEPSITKTAKRLPRSWATEAPVLKVTYNKESKQNLLTWLYPQRTSYRIAIYRAEAKQGYHLIGFAKASESQFVDKPLQSDRYKYVLKVLFSDGQESPFSAAVEVKML